MYCRSKQVYRKSRHRTPSGDRVSFSGLWLLIGLLIGILSAVSVYLLLTGKWTTPEKMKKMEKLATVRHLTRHSKSSAQKKEPVQRFEFYQLLPGMEVPIPDTDVESPKASIQKLPPKTTPTLAKTQTKLAAAQYLIQAGAYRRLSSAETLKSRLSSQGFIARIQKIEAEDGIWYRVILGPFSSEAMALNQKNRLIKQNIYGILILQRS